MRILITNDDGPLSPLLLPFAETISSQPWCKFLCPVIPAQEQSWVAQAVTRFNPVFAREHEFGSLKGHLLSGTPSDCVSIGADYLCAERPELVISGINIGNNAGLPFYLSSGTVAAARQGFLCGIRSIALSVDAPTEIFQIWNTTNLASTPELSDSWKGLAKLGTDMVSRLVSTDAWNFADFFSVNIPWEVNKNSSIRLTRLKPGKYQKLFAERKKNEFIHSLEGVDFESRREDYAGSRLPWDMDVLKAGEISITPIRHTMQSYGGSEIEKLSQALAI